ncbi:MAG: AAA family ATPase [Pseudomonadota bacterium]
MSADKPIDAQSNMQISAKDRAKKLVDNGFRPIPIPYGTKAPRIKGWQKYEAMPEAIEKDFRVKNNIGLLLRDNPMIDIDVRVPAVAEILKGEALKRWPEALERVGLPPKVGLFVRCDEPFRKLCTSDFKINGQKCQVEILCDGQQAVAFGMHPDTGKDYEWIGRTPCEVARQELPLITEVEAQDFINWCEAELSKVAKAEPTDEVTTVSSRRLAVDPPPMNVKALGASIRQRRTEYALDEWDSLSPEDKAIEVQRLITLIEETPRNTLNYDEWISFSHAVKGVLDVEAYQAWYDHCMKYRKNAYTDLEAKWGGLSPESRAGPGTIVHHLSKCGLSEKLISQTAIEANEKRRNLKEASGTAVQPEKVNPINPSRFVIPDETNIPPRDWLYGWFLIRGYVSLTVAPGGAGKSALCMSESLALATGKNLMEESVRKPLKVWVWNGEDPNEELQRRLTAACKHFGVSQDMLCDRLMVDSGRQLPIKIAEYRREGLKVAEPLIEELISTIKREQIDVLRIDPFVTTHMVPENDNGPINEVIDAWRRIASEANCAVELVHHVNKSAALNKDQGIYGARGAGAMIDGARVAR